MDSPTKTTYLLEDELMKDLGDFPSISHIYHNCKIQFVQFMDSFSEDLTSDGFTYPEGKAEMQGPLIGSQLTEGQCQDSVLPL